MNLFNTSALAEATPTATAAGGMASSLIMIVVMIAVFYFLTHMMTEIRAAIENDSLLDWANEFYARHGRGNW